MEAAAMIARLIAVVMLISFGTAIDAVAEHRFVTEQNYKACNTHSGVNWFFNAEPNVANPASCREACYRYAVSCKDRTSFQLSSRYDPYASDGDIFWYESSGALKFLLVALLGFYGFAATMGTRNADERARAVAGNVLCLALITFDVWTWGAHAVAANSLPAVWDDLPGGVVHYLVLPVFLIVQARAFWRGCNYLFVQHPAASMISTAMRSKAPINTKVLSQTLVSGAADEGSEPAYHYEHQAEKARKLRDELHARAAAAEAQARIELRRAELLEAERHLEELKRRSGSMR